MYISPLLWVGHGPKEPYLPTPGVQGVRHATSAPEAAMLIKEHWAVVVATTEIAYEVLRLLGKGHSFASQATVGMTHGYSSPMFEDEPSVS
jgi:hypothetical protein